MRIGLRGILYYINAILYRTPKIVLVIIKALIILTREPGLSPPSGKHNRLGFRVP